MPSSQSADHQRAQLKTAAAWAAASFAVLALAVWMEQLRWLWIGVAAVGTVGCIVSQGWSGRRTRSGAAATVALWLAVGVAAGFQLQLHRLATEWPAVREQVENRAAATLQRALDDLVDRGEEAAGGAQEVAAAHAQRGERAFSALEQVREAAGVDALAVFGPNGAPIIWAGEHRGMIPGAVRLGQRAYVFQEGPLFGYLYFVRALGGGRTAVAAVLLEANGGAGGAHAAFAKRFARRYTVVPRFHAPEKAPPEAVWDWSTDRPILSVAFAQLTQEAWRERLVQRSRWGVGVAWAVALLLLGAAWFRRRTGHAGIPVLVFTSALMLLPLGSILGAQGLFSPLRFLFPVPGDLTLGEMTILLAGTSVWLFTHARADLPDRWRLNPWLALALLAALLPVAVAVVAASAAPAALAAAPGGGFAMQGVATLLLAIPVAALLLATRLPEPPLPAWVLWGVLLLGVAPSLLMVLRWSPGSTTPPWAALLWLPAFALLLHTRAPRWFARRELFAWLMAGWIASTMFLPLLWVLHMDARMEEAERELTGLGTEADPYLDYLLRQFADAVQQGDERGDDGVNLLYRGWVASGLAGEGYEARLALWQRGRIDAELRLSDTPLPANAASRLAERAASREVQLDRFTQLSAVHYLLTVPLNGDRAVTVTVPPRRRLGRATPLARLIRADAGQERVSDYASLSLIPLRVAEQTPGAVPGPRAPVVQWVKLRNAWRSETVVRFPDGWMHAHLLIAPPPLLSLAMRAILVQAAVLATLLLLWIVARLLCGDLRATAQRRGTWTRSFRGRLTLALFGFFLLPTVLLGAVAYSAVAREVVRTAATLAWYSLDQAGERAENASVNRRAAPMGTDLLLYENGLLVNAASRELLELGLFHAWLPPDVFLGFAHGAEQRATKERRLGESRYLVAYRRYSGGEVLAVPIPLASGEIARRQDEFAYVALFLALVGAGLSVLLALLVGRALTRPIEELSRATALVGSGDLRLHLREEQPDEFGSVYRAFNRMVRQLRSTRAALLRETKRTEAVVAEAATGILALDSAGNVALANLRAQHLLGVELPVAQPLPARTAASAELARALRRFRASRAADWGTDLEVDGRELRLRFRRLPGQGVAAGTVVALEDITDELRSARILAWGEMARQVAHEIKNPLTPIKLSVQHLRRAFSDGRPDFGAILDRNVSAILDEIDRLGEIARAFARFGAPAPAPGELEAVHLHPVIAETLTLYRGGGGNIEYRIDVDLALPPVLCRTAELKEVLVNLLENARAALPDGGEIRIIARPVSDGPAVLLDIEDNGVGIAPEALPRIFEPQFSTRTSGTGLGLAIVRRLVEGWSGEVSAESILHRGTTVHLRLQTAAT